MPWNSLKIKCHLIQRSSGWHQCFLCGFLQSLKTYLFCWRPAGLLILAVAQLRRGEQTEIKMGRETRCIHTEIFPVSPPNFLGYLNYFSSFLSRFPSMLWTYFCSVNENKRVHIILFSSMNCKEWAQSSNCPPDQEWYQCPQSPICTFLRYCSPRCVQYLDLQQYTSLALEMYINGS